ncbi:hypothetical protein ACKLNO_09450 [Neisseriaceae bacterium B1]
MLANLGCSITNKVPDFPKNWRPINELPEVTQVIPLNRPHVYRVTPLDATVKGLLNRWGEEAKMPIVYDSAYDFTVFKSLLQIQTENLEEALVQLSQFYEAQNIVFRVQDGVIVAFDKQNVVLTQQKNKK